MGHETIFTSSRHVLWWSSRSSSLSRPVIHPLTTHCGLAAVQDASGGVGGGWPIGWIVGLAVVAVATGGGKRKDIIDWLTDWLTAHSSPPRAAFSSPVQIEFIVNHHHPPNGSFIDQWHGIQFHSICHSDLHRISNTWPPNHAPIKSVSLPPSVRFWSSYFPVQSMYRTEIAGQNATTSGSVDREHVFWGNFNYHHRHWDIIYKRGTQQLLVILIGLWLGIQRTRHGQMKRRRMRWRTFYDHVHRPCQSDYRRVIGLLNDWVSGTSISARADDLSVQMDRWMDRWMDGWESKWGSSKGV